MKTYGVITVVVLAMVAVAWFSTNGNTSTQGCPKDEMVCLDGSRVTRTGPTCTFAPCADGTASTTDTTPPVTSGVQGIIRLGPTCPVERMPPDPACAEKPYATSIFVYRKGSDAVFIIATSDKTGAFKFALPSGAYTLAAQGGTPLPRCSSVFVTVPQTGYASTTISCDTGIR